MQKITIGDVLEIHYIDNNHRYFYINFLRPLTKEDFIQVNNQVPNSIQFILDEDLIWNYRKKSDVTGFVAEIIIKFKHTEDIINGLKKFLDNLEFNQAYSQLQRVFKLYNTGISIKYNYKGCATNESKEKKDAAQLEELKKKVQEFGERQIKSLYSDAISKIKEDIDREKTHHITMIARLYNANSTLHEDIKKMYPEEIKQKDKEIDEAVAKIEELRLKIDSLRKEIAIEHIKLCEKELLSDDDFPEEVKQEIIKQVKEFKPSFGARRFF